MIFAIMQYFNSKRYTINYVFLLLPLLHSRYVMTLPEQGRNRTDSRSLTQSRTIESSTAYLNSVSKYVPPLVFPIERGVCGNWMQDYADVHKKITTGQLPPR